MSMNLSAHHETAGLIIEDPLRRRGILLAVCIALMAVIASVTGLNVAQPQIALAFDASQSQVLWMINIYAITLAALLLPLGAAGDRWGRKPMLLMGLVIFGVANATAGLASSYEMMLVARFLSGVGAAMIMPVTLAVITATFPDEERARAIGVWTAVAGGGGLLGMVLSAILVDEVSWRALFILPLVLVLMAGVMTVRPVPSSREESEHPFDVVGALTSVIAVIGLSFALHEGPEQGWTTSTTLLSFLIGIAGALGFIGWERRHQAPLLDLTVFRHRGLTSGSLFILVGFGV